MAYLGPPPSQKLATPTSQYFSGNGSTTAFTLNRPVNVAEDLNVFVNNVAQQPGSGKSYTATGTTLTFDAAPDAGTNNVYVVYRGLSEGTLRLEQDPNSGITATTGTFSGDLTVDTTTLKVDSTNNRVGIGTASPLSDLHQDIALSDREGHHLYYGTDAKAAFTVLPNTGEIRVGAATTGTSGNYYTEIMSRNGSNLVTSLKADTYGRVTMPNQPAFHAYGTSGSWTVFSNGSWTKLVLPAAALNTGTHYDTTNSKFVAPVAAVYHFYYKVYGRVQSGGAASTYWQSRFQKNNNAISGYGSNIMAYQYNVGGIDEITTYSANISLAANDEITLHAQAAGGSNGEYYPPGCEFGGHLIG
jgi:hypothetical protein